MAEIVNLNRARKAKAKTVAKSKAETNRLSFGRSKLERDAAAKANQRAIAHIDGHKRED